MAKSKAKTNREEVIIRGVKGYNFHLIKMTKFKETDKPTYKVTICIPKTNKANLKVLEAAIVKVLDGDDRDDDKTFLGYEWSDGDGKERSKKHAENPHHVGCWVLNLKNPFNKVPVYTKTKTKLTDEEVARNCNNGATINVCADVRYSEASGWVSLDLKAIELEEGCARPERDHSKAFGENKDGEESQLVNEDDAPF